MFKTFRRLMGFTRPFWRGMLGAVALAVFTIGCSVGLMATSAWLISKSGLQPSIADLGASVVLVRFFGVFRAVFRYLERLVSHDVTFRLLADLRVWFYSRVEPLAPARLSAYRSGDLMGRVIADIEELQNVYIRVIAPPLVAIVTGLIIAVLFAALDIWAMLVALAYLTFAGTVLPWLAWRQGQGPGRKLVRARSAMNAALVDSIQGLADTIAYGQTERQQAQLNALDDELVHNEQRLNTLDSFQVGLGVLLVNLAALSVLFIAIPRVDGIWLGTLTLATIAAFEAITPLASTANHFGRSLEAAERLFEVVDAEPVVRDHVDVSATMRDASIEAHNLTFRYTAEADPALSDVSFKVEEGQRVAIVGASGAGKSTLINLLLRLWETQHGTLSVGGHSVRAYTQEDLRREIAVMSQRTHLFNTTIKENIRIARPEADDEAIIDAAQRAQIHDFILSLPDGYDTYVGEAGGKLSGGERQRIALARALLKDAPIFAFDEATANLDAVTEQAVMQAVLEATRGKTMLFISHRLTLLDDLDHIIVLDGGRIVEQGTHQQLVAANAFYAQMLRLQRQIIAA